MNRAVFYDKVRPLFGHRILPKQFEGMQVILDEWTGADLRQLAYMLATTFHETAFTMQPVQEYGGKAYFIRRYYENEKIRKALGNLSAEDAVNYSGKGYVQITGRANYKRIGERLDIDLVNNPALAMRPDIAVKIMFAGMMEGIFTGKKLSDYFDGAKADWINARRIINGLDQARKIAGYANQFHVALQ